MKKLIQIGAFLSLVFVFSIVAAKAQTTVKQYEAKIPFDFNIGQKSYQAGNYVIKISRLASNGLSLSLEDDQRNSLQTILVSETGNLTKGAPQLVFNRQEDQRYLTGILTKEVGVAIGTPKAEKHQSGKNQPAASNPQPVAEAAAQKQ